MIWHIFRKDARLLWPLAAAVAASHLLAAILSFSCHCGGDQPGHVALVIAGVLTLAFTIGSIALVTGMVHQDPVPGDDQDWLTRPIHRRDMIGAKLLGVLLLYCSPGLLIDVLIGMAHGFPFLDILRTAVAHAASSWLLPGLSLLAIAAATRSLGQVFAMLAACSVSAGGFFLLTMVLNDGPPDFSDAGIDWVISLLALLIFVGGCGGVIWGQYRYRRNWISRTLLCVVAGLSTTPLFLPAASTVAIEHAFSADRTADANVSMRLATPGPWPAKTEQLPSSGWKPLRLVPAVDNGDRKDGKHVLLQIPLQISGLPADSILRTERTSARLIDANGKTVFENQLRDLNLRVSGEAADDDAVRGWQMLKVPKSVYESSKDRPLRLELEQALILMTPSAHYTLPMDRRKRNLAGIGRCSISPGDQPGKAQLQCTVVAEKPSCLVVAPSDNPAAERVVCAAASSPFHVQLDDLADEGGSITLRTSDAPSASWTITAYEPVDRFSQSLSFDGVKLADLNVGLPGATREEDTEEGDAP